MKRSARRVNRRTARRMSYQEMEPRRLLAYSDEVLADNPLVYFRFEENAPSGPGDATDASGNANHGTYSSTVSLGNPSFSTNLGSALDLDNGAATPNMSVAVPALGTFSQLTVETWLHPRSIATFDTIYNTDNFPTGSLHYQLHASSGGSLEFTINQGGANDLFFGGGQFTLGQWVHAVTTYDQSTGNVEVFLNGNSLGTQTFGGTTSPAILAAAHIGAWNGNSRQFDGLIDEFALYGSLLPETRIDAHFAAASAVGPSLDAVDDDYTASNAITEKEVLTIADGPTDLTANDNPPGASVTGFDATSVNGAAVSVNADGSFTYDPSGSANIQALNTGESLTDSFTYTIGGASATQTILATDFTGRVVSGDSATNLTWFTNGVADPGDLTAFEEDGDGLVELAGLHDTAAAQGYFAPNLNTGNEGPWSTGSSLSLSLTVPQISLENVMLDYQHFSNAGAFQGGPHPVNWTATVTGSVSGQLGSVQVIGVSSISGTETIVFSPPLMLTNSETYVVRILAENGDTVGNNTSIDAISLNGIIPQAPDTATVRVRVNGVTDLIAADDDYTSSNPIAKSEVLTIPNGPSDILANDNPPNATITAFDATSVNGAAVAVNADGSFTYDPAGSATIQALGGGQSLTDTFTYTISGPSAGSEVILSTDFTGRTVSGDTATNITWFTNGVADPGDLTAVEEDGDGLVELAGLFDTANAQGHFAPNLNTGNEGPWSTSSSLTLDLTVPQLSLDSVLLDYQHFNNSGNFQAGPHPVNWTVTVTGSVSGQLGSIQAIGASTISGIETIVFSPPLVLTDSETYVVRILAENGDTVGNNTALDAITINGTLPNIATATVSVLVSGQAAFAAVDDDYTASQPIGESGTLDTAAAGAAGLLANDSPASATILGINGTALLSGTTANGATVTVNPDGSFVYDTNGQLESLAQGATLTDTFTYTISDGNGGMETATASIRVNGENDLPTTQAVSIAANEDGTPVTASFDADDLDSEDDSNSLAYAITTSPTEGIPTNNNDGTFTFDPAGDFQDLAQGATRVVSFDYTATDSQGAASTSSISVTVTGVNDAPTVTVNSSTTTVEEGQVATNSGTFADIDAGDSVTLTASAGTITQDPGNAGNWSWSLASDDGPSQSQTVTLTATDEEGGTAVITFDLTVDNVAPTAAISGLAETLVNSPVTFAFSATDPSTADQAAGFTFTVDWGDGSPVASVPPSSSTHVFTAVGQYTVTVTATDKDGGTSAAVTHTIDITIPLEPVVQIGDDIVVTGTDASDRIIFLPANGGFRVRFNNRFFPLDGGIYSVNFTTQLIVNGNAGSDTVIVNGTIGAPAVFDGGVGNDYLVGGTDSDTLIGGAGNDVLLGGEGDNRLEGGAGNDRAEGRDGIDWIFGGDGNDRLNGGGGNDILDGGGDNDVLFGGHGDDLLAGREGSDTLNGYVGNDVLYGGGGTDQIFGDGDNDLLFGGTGFDRLRGDGGDDTLVGGSSALEADTEASLDALLAGGTMLPAVQAALEAWFASQGATSRMLYELFNDDGATDELTGGTGVNTFKTGSNDAFRDASSGNIVLP